jgi:hypothetical protein
VIVDYYPWCDDQDESFAWIVETPKEIDDDEWRLGEGKPAASWFPKEVTYRLEKEGGVKVGDYIKNASRLLFVSARLKEFLEKNASESRIEFFPVKIRNHKGRLIDKPFFIANPIGAVACLDQEKSDFRWGAIAKDQVDRFRRLVLDESKIPRDLKLFRLAEQTNLVIVRRDLAQDIVDNDFTGMFFMEMEDYGMEWRGGKA